MRQVFVSKFGWEVYIPVFLIVAAVTVGITYDVTDDTSRRYAYLLMGGLQGLLIQPFIGTSYTLEGNQLKVVCSFLYRRTFDLTELIQIEKTNSWTSAPAPSLDRLELTFQGGQTLVISPKDQAGFWQAVQLFLPSGTKDKK